MIVTSSNCWHVCHRYDGLDIGVSDLKKTLVWTTITPKEARFLARFSCGKFAFFFDVSQLRTHSSLEVWFLVLDVAFTLSILPSASKNTTVRQLRYESWLTNVLLAFLLPLPHFDQHYRCVHNQHKKTHLESSSASLGDREDVATKRLKLSKLT